MLTLDEALHALGGFAFFIVATKCGLNPTWAIAAMFWFGLGREWWQHGHPPDSWHQVREAVAWPIGSTLAFWLI